MSTTLGMGVCEMSQQLVCCYCHGSAAPTLQAPAFAALQRHTPG